MASGAPCWTMARLSSFFFFLLFEMGSTPIDSGLFDKCPGTVCDQPCEFLLHFLSKKGLRFARPRKPRYGSKLSHQRTAGFSPCFHLPGFQFGVTLFLTHIHHPSASPSSGQMPCSSPCWTVTEAKRGSLGAHWVRWLGQFMSPFGCILE